MKKKKVLAVLVALLLVIGAGVYTYARYTFTRTGNGNAEVARWTASLTDGANALTDNFNLPMTLSTNNYVVNGKIAPNRSATASLVVDLTGTEVATDIEVSIGSITGLPDGMTISGVTATPLGGSATALTLNDGKYSTTIELNAGKTAISANTVTLEITATWTNSDANDADDTTHGTTGGSLSIPVTVTAKQHIA